MSRLTILLILFTQFASAQQYELAVIEDPGGFSYVREQPSASAPILFQIPHYAVFECARQPGDWWLFRSLMLGTQKNREGKGFIHKSRVKVIKEMPDSVMGNVFRQVLHIYHHVILEMKATPKNNSIVNKRDELYEYYWQVLDLLNAHLLRTKDNPLMLAWFRIIIDDTGNAAEAPGYAIASLFVAAPEWVAGTIRTFPPKKRQILYGAIYIGLVNADTESRTNIDKLEKLMQEDLGMK